MKALCVHVCLGEGYIRKCVYMWVRSCVKGVYMYVSVFCVWGDTYASVCESYWLRAYVCVCVGSCMHEWWVPYNGMYMCVWIYGWVIGIFILVWSVCIYVCVNCVYINKWSMHVCGGRVKNIYSFLSICLCVSVWVYGWQHICNVWLKDEYVYMVIYM